MTRENFEIQLGRLSILPGMPSDVDGHWDVLHDVPEELFESAVGRALRTRKWFPVPSELREDAELSKPRTFYVPPSPAPGPSYVAHIPNPFGGKGITVTVHEDYHYYCQHCSDTGWASFWCGPATPLTRTWHRMQKCDRLAKDDFYPHEFVRPCACIASNPHVQRKRDSQAQFAAQREEESRKR